MRVLRQIDLDSSPLAQEEELLRKLRRTGACSSADVRLVVAGHKLFVEGFVGSVNEKLRVEKACRRLAPQCDLVNRLRVASQGEPQVS
jgi:hypothetical protein